MRRWLSGEEGSEPEDVPRNEGPARDERFDALARALPLGVIMLGRNLRVNYANRIAGAIFGFDRRRVRGMHLIEAIPSVGLERRANSALQLEQAEAPLIIGGKTGDRTYEVSVYPLLAGRGDEEEEEKDPAERGGDVTGVLIVADDQTEILKLERARQEFLTNVSHELRTPLSSVKLMIETVLQAADDEAQKMFLPQALVQVDRLAVLVQRLLEQARIESGQLVLRIEELDLEEIARPIVSSFEPRAVSAGVTLELRSLRPAIIEADGDRLSQVFVNLIDNALRYTPAGGFVTITLDVADGYAVIAVADSGIGIPLKDRPYVFERFYVVERSRTRDSERPSGAGLGLSIVKDIAEAHHGAAHVDSRLGHGTTFTVRIPVAPPAS